MDISHQLKEITDKKKALAERIRWLMRIQRKLWRKVPWLALEADGRDGYSPTFLDAHKHGLWPLRHGRPNDVPLVFIDLATGELVYDSSICAKGDRSPKRCRDEDVLLLLNDTSELDAAKLIAHLKARIAEPPKSYAAKTPEELRKWREELREARGLTPTYTRKR